MEQLSLFDTEKIYTQEELNKAIVKALIDMTDVLIDKQRQIEELRKELEAIKNESLH